VKVEFVWRLRQINAVLDFKVALHSGLTTRISDRVNHPRIYEQENLTAE
jgi:hypothetical protein